MDAMSARASSGTLNRLLADLRDGATGPEWETLRAGALHSGEIDADTDAVLLQLRARLDESSRRERLLRVLYDTATDLIAIRDVEAILKAIVRRTRTLLGSDIAYLSLNDYDRDESYVRVTDGATTGAFRNIRLPLGGGVLGAVATGSAPAQSADYPSDTTKTHFPDSDAAVIGEGVKAIMGVPLWAEGRVIGALLVADRHAHDFSSADVALMESIGAHAAVALENARLFTEMADTLDRLHRAQGENAEHVRALESLTSLDRQLLESLAESDVSRSLQGIVASATGVAAWIVGIGGESIAGDDVPGPVRETAGLVAVDQSRSERRPVAFGAVGEGEDDGAGGHTVMAATAGDQHLATIVIDGARTPARDAVLERSALVLSAAMLFERSLRDAQYRLQRELIDELLGPRTEITVALRDRARRFGITDETAVVVRAAAVRDEQRQRAVAVLRAHASGRAAIVALHGASVCVLETVASDAQRSDDGSMIVDVLAAEGIAADVGSSMPVRGLQALPGAFAQAHAVQLALTALGRHGEAADPAGLGTAGMLLGAMDSPFPAQMLRTQLGPLLDYDERRGTELTMTAWVYLDADGSHTAAADRLRIHPNTMRQRLERIDGLVGADWRRGGRALDVHIALRLWRLQNAGVITARV